jgi:hypothetical protein
MTTGMKVEIDLNDILADEDGSETLAESVRRQVVEHLTKKIGEGVGHAISCEVSRLINEEIANAMKDRMPAILDDLLNAEYVQVDRWGGRDGSTTFRKELVKSIHEQMKYVKATYDSEKNAFTKAVDSIIAENVKEFKADFDKQVNATFTQEAMSHATKKLREKLGITA